MKPASKIRPRSRRQGKPKDAEFYSSLIRLHILHHATKEPVFGLWLIDELHRHGYRIGPGTLYPLLHGMEQRGLLRSATQRNGSATRRLYSTTASGRRTLARAKIKVLELFGEIFDIEKKER
jgi:DNA-binding PadR family transcriptional regulator